MNLVRYSIIPLVLDWVYRAAGQQSFCLNELPKNLKNLTYKGKEYRFRLGRGIWDSPKVPAEILRILLVEKMGIDTPEELTVGGSSEETLKLIAGCDLSMECTDEEKAAGKFQDPPAIWAAADVWTTSVQESRLSKAYTEVTGFVGYVSSPGLYAFPEAIAKAKLQGIHLGFWEALSTPEARDCCFSDVAAIDAELKTMTRQVPFFGFFLGCCDTLGCDSPECSKPGYLLPSCRPGNLEYTMMLEKGYTCEDGWYYSPACQDNKTACIPVILGVFQWNMIEWCEIAREWNIPLAITTVGAHGWFGEMEAIWQLHAKGFSVLHYWWNPDMNFLSIKPKMVIFREEMMLIRQNQNTQKVMWPKIREFQEGQDIENLLKSFVLSNKVLDGFMVKLAEGVQSPRDIACAWLKDNEDIWSPWLPRKEYCNTGFIYNNESQACEPCPPGTISASRGKTKCEPCSAGKFQAVPGSSECNPCETGTFSANASANCDRCEVGKYADAESATECTSCPQSFTTPFLGAANLTDCICDQGKYLNDQLKCQKCIADAGLVCLGDKVKAGDTPPEVLAGYMVAPYDAEKKNIEGSGAYPPELFPTFICESEKKCPGTKDPKKWSDVCFGGRTGFACGKCPENYYSNGDKGCEECSESYTDVITLVCIFAPIFFAYLYHKLNTDNEYPDADDSEEIKEMGTKQLSKSGTGSLHWQSGTGSLAKQLYMLSKTKEQTGLRRWISRLQAAFKLGQAFLEDVVKVIRDCIGLLLEYIQMVYLVAAIGESGWTGKLMANPFNTLEGISGLLSFEVDSNMSTAIPIACFTGNGFESRFLFNLSIPLIFLLCFLVNYGVFKAAIQPLQGIFKKAVGGKKGPGGILQKMWSCRMKWDKVVNAMGTQITKLFIGITSLSLAIFVLVEHPPDGSGQRRFSIQRFHDVLADSDERSAMIPIAIAGLLVYTVGVVALSIWVCITAPSSSHHGGFSVRYYFLLDGFRPNRWWWGSYLLMKGLVFNLVMAVFESPKTKAMFCSVLVMISLAMLFLFAPWPLTIQNTIDTACHLCLAVVLSATTLRIQAAASDELEMDFKMATASLITPMVITVICGFMPVIIFFTQTSQRILNFRHGQQLRDLLMLATSRTSNEMNVFLRSLDDADRQTLTDAMSVFYSKMFYLHPPHQNRIIQEVDTYRAGEASLTKRLLEEALFEENRNALSSLEEIACMQSFLEKVIEGYRAKRSGVPGALAPIQEKSVKSEATSFDSEKQTSTSRRTSASATEVEDISLPDIFEALDENASGEITIDDFVRVSCSLNAAISESIATKVFKMMDLDEGGTIDKKEFLVMMSAMTLTGQVMDQHTWCGKHLRPCESPEKMEDHRKTVHRMTAKLFQSQAGSRPNRFPGTMKSKSNVGQSHLHEMAGIFGARKIQAAWKRKKEWKEQKKALDDADAASQKGLDDWFEGGFLDVALMQAGLSRQDILSKVAG